MKTRKGGLGKIRAKSKQKKNQKNLSQKKREWVIWPQDRMLRRPKRGSRQDKKIKTKWNESMKTNEKMMNMSRILAQVSIMEDVEKSSNAWIQSIAHLEKYHNGFKPFISFLSITWTRLTLQPLNKSFLEVLLIESTHLALMIFSLGLRRKTTQDYQAPLANIFKRQNFQILKWLKKKNSKLQALNFFASNKK